MKISIVATLYCSESHIYEFCQRVRSAVEMNFGNSYELILVNDGSPDNSLEVALAAAKENNKIVVVDLSRNFGHYKAMMTGLSYAKGELIYLLDSDLEEEPEWLSEFYKEMVVKSADVVYGVQLRRKGRWFERISGSIFYTLFNLLTEIKIPKNIVTARLMKRQYVLNLLEHKEREVFIAGLWQITGFEQIGIPIEKHSTSETTYTFSKKMSLFVNSITSFSSFPLVAIFYLGVFILLFASVYIGYILYLWLKYSSPLLGWTSLMASIWFLGGLIISLVGVVGIYISKIYIETKSRPYSIVKKIYENQC